jgi:hypothetical protein
MLNWSCRAMKFGLFIAGLSAVAAPLNAKVQVSKLSEMALPPLEEGWRRADNRRAVLGAYDYRIEGPFIVDKQLLEPERTLAACRSNGDGSDARYWKFVACSLFLYPSAQSLAGADEARATYEGAFSGSHSPAERIAMAMSKGSFDDDWEIRKFATPAVLNTFIPFGRDGEIATVGEVYAFNHAGDPERVQWLYDKGARPCMIDSPTPTKRFSCIQFYLKADGTTMSQGGVYKGNQPFLDTIGVLERNGFRPRTKTELAAAAEWRDVIGSNGTAKQHFLSLLSAADRRQVDAQADAARRKQESDYAASMRADDDRLIAATSGESPSRPKARQIVTNLSPRGLPVCQVITSNGRRYVFRAVVEGNGGGRLQLRASSIRGSGSELANMPYGDTRVDTGTIFWDDPHKWSSDC